MSELQSDQPTATMSKDSLVSRLTRLLGERAITCDELCILIYALFPPGETTKTSLSRVLNWKRIEGLLSAGTIDKEQSHSHKKRFTLRFAGSTDPQELAVQLAASRSPQAPAAADAKPTLHQKRAEEIQADETFQRVVQHLRQYFSERSTSAWTLAQGTKSNRYKHYQIMCSWDENGFDWAAYAEWYRDEGLYQTKGFQWPLFLSAAVVSQFQSVQEGRQYTKKKKDRYLKTTTNLKNDEAFQAEAKAFREQWRAKQNQGADS